MNNITDDRGHTIRPGDRVFASAWGYGLPLAASGERGTVVRLLRKRVRVQFDAFMDGATHDVPADQLRVV